MSESCAFCRIIRRESPARVVYEDEQALAFEDIHPQAPVHILIVPRKHLAGLNDASGDDEPLLGHLHTLAARLAKERGIEATGYRTVFNTGRGAGQSVFHLHLHLLGGRSFRWPPG